MAVPSGFRGEAKNKTKHEPLTTSFLPLVVTYVPFHSQTVLTGLPTSILNFTCVKLSFTFIVFPGSVVPWQVSRNIFLQAPKNSRNFYEHIITVNLTSLFYEFPKETVVLGVGI